MKSNQQTVNEIKTLANSLEYTMKQRKSKYPLCSSHVEKLLETWEHANSKHIIHLTNLPEYFILEFDKSGQKIINENYNGITIKTLKSRKTTSSIDTLEKHVTCIRTRKSKPPKIEGIPINLTDENWRICSCGHFSVNNLETIGYNLNRFIYRNISN